MAEQKIYLPKSSARIHRFQSGGEIMKLGLNVDAAIEFLQQHRNDRGYVNLVVAERRAPSERGDTHYIALDTWKPRQTVPTQQQPVTPQTSEPVQRAPDDDVPF